MKDIIIMLEYLEDHDPFKTRSAHLVDISTGISYPNANAHKGLDIGNVILDKMDGVDVYKYKFKKVDKIKQMGERVLIGKEMEVMDPLVLFERALVIADISDITKKYVFEHELSHYPPSLFGSNGLLRSADDKSNLTDYIAQKCLPESTPEDENNLTIEITVIDMGSLLRSRVKFYKGDTYGEIIQQYINTVQIYPNCVPVFDGYSDDSPSTKYITLLKRSRKVTPCHAVEIAHHLPFKCKDAFFTNKSNNQSFINLLSKALDNNNISVLHAKGDAEQLIAIDLTVNYTT